MLEGECNVSEDSRCCLVLIIRNYRRKGAPSEDSIFQCIGMLAQSVGPALTKHMHELLDLMFAYGLSPSLHAALQQLGRDIPPLLPDIQGEMIPRCYS